MIINPKAIKFHKDIIADYISGASFSFLISKYGVSHGCLFRLFKESGVWVRRIPEKTPINDNYFSNIDSNEKSYFLGLMYADGWIASDAIAGINLKSEDAEILEKMSKCIYLNEKPLKALKNKIGKPQSLLTLNSRSVVMDLKRLGCVPAKSLILDFPSIKQVPITHLSHFLRGYFDGDGSIYLRKNNTISLSIVTSLSFGKGLANLLLTKDIRFHTETINTSGTTVFRISGNTQALKFLNYIYNHHKGLYLTRKFNRYRDYVSFLSGREKGYTSTKILLSEARSLV